LINIYPANRLENLVFLFDRVMHNDTSSAVLSEEIILVQSKGMQHWLNLQLAQSRGISMNLKFSLPMQFFWDQIRLILGRDKVPEKSAYSREVLSWRIFDLLAGDAIINNPQCQQATNYWFSKDTQQANKDKRFQLACQLADCFEQYLIFRPDWIINWEQGKFGSDPGEQWQGIIWQLLLAQDAQQPVALLKEAMQKLTQSQCTLPRRISLFGINTLPPLWLEFLSELGEYTQIHFFHLNPCVEYWGDLKTDKAQAKEQFYRWINSADRPVFHADDDNPTIIETTNPLLANLGIQGKDFLYLLQEHSGIEIPVYESPEILAQEQGEQATVLQYIQADILQLQDRSYDDPLHIIDNSIHLVSAHSALREIQALHDWLLLQINNDPSLTPKDILVMCPNVENYAPYVDAVFAHGWYDWSERVPPLPCSIADRVLKDAEPLVQAFIDLLELPDSRFQVSQIIAYLRLPAVQDKFSFGEADLLILERWINHAAIHWGLDSGHKQQILEKDKKINNKFTWQQGLNRLLLGFAQGDQASIYHDQLLLSDIEGDEALLLGRYFELLEQLKYYARTLTIDRTAADWQPFLLQAKENLFSTLSDDSHAQQIIEQAIDDLGEYTHHAGCTKKLPLSIIRDFLLNHFSQPDQGRQFMAGQVTFCSMVPMRSVPFRIIAVLGLNDGEFPRQRQPMGFDLMANNLPRKGDRSLRGDDRYLFLEALISCREKLYLSYQGHDVKTNNQREPSLVLQELIHYLEKGYGWQLSKDEQAQLYQVPLQAFNKANYSGANKSFNPHWLKLSEPGEKRNNLAGISAAQDNDELAISAEQLLQFFENPSKQYAQQRLGLYLGQNNSDVLQDSEPFVANYLDRYLIQQEMLQAKLNNTDNKDLIHNVQLSGRLPDTPVIIEELADWQTQANDFSEVVKEILNDKPLETQSISITLDNMQLTAELPLVDNSLVFWRLASPKGKDDMRLWIHHLIAQIAIGSCTTRGIFRGDKEQVLTVHFEPVDNAPEILSHLLQCWRKGMQQPLLLNAALGQKHCILKKNRKKKLDSKPLNNALFSAYWHDTFQAQGLGSDPYINWFWGDSIELPPWQDHWQARIEEIYQPLYSQRQEQSV